MHVFIKDPDEQEFVRKCNTLWCVLQSAINYFKEWSNSITALSAFLFIYFCQNISFYLIFHVSTHSALICMQETYLNILGFFKASLSGNGGASDFTSDRHRLKFWSCRFKEEEEFYMFTNEGWGLPVAAGFLLNPQNVIFLTQNVIVTFH